MSLRSAPAAGLTLDDDETRCPLPGGGDAMHQTLVCLSSADGSETNWHTLDTDARLAAGKQLPGTRYRLLRWIGQGGMGEIFEAIHVDIQRRVALKIVKHGASEVRREQFLAEAQAIAKIESRFVVDVLDFGELPDGRPFYVMELLESNDLNDLLQAEGPLPLRRAVPIMRQLCKALAAVHACGLAHRDVKPRNILLQQSPERADTIRVVDFGISEPFAHRAKRIAGTVNYMAPEQITGDTFDGRVDIYALGCLFYEMLSGEFVFKGQPMAVLKQHLNAAPDSLSGRQPELPEQTDEFLARCLVKDPAERYANVHEVEAALCELQIAAGFTTPWDDLPLPAIDARRQAELAARMPRPPPRARLWPLLSVGLGLGAALGLGAWLLSSSDDGDAGDVQAEAELAWITTYANHAQAAAARAYWVYPPASDPDTETARTWVLALEDRAGFLNLAAHRRARELRVEFASTLIRLGDHYWGQEHGRPFAVEYYAQALMFDPSNQHAWSRVALTEAQLADVGARAARGEYIPAELETAGLIAALAEADEDSRRRRVVEVLGASAPLRRRASGGAPILELVGAREADVDEPRETGNGEAPALEDTQLAPEATGPNLERAAALAQRGRKALDEGERVKAERLFHKAIEIDSRNVVSVSGLAQVYFDRGSYGKALGFARKAKQLRPHDAGLRLLLGDIYLKVLRYPDARAQYQSSLELGDARAKKRLILLDELTG